MAHLLRLPKATISSAARNKLSYNAPAPLAYIKRDWYETLKATRLHDSQAKKLANQSFLARHDLAQIKEVRDALAVITQVLSK